MAGRAHKGIKKISSTADQRPGNDAPFYESPGGVLFAAAGFGNEAGVGVPETPSLRGAPPPVGSSHLPTGGSGSKNGVLNSFIMEKK